MDALARNLRDTRPEGERKKLNAKDYGKLDMPWRFVAIVKGWGGPSSTTLEQGHRQQHDRYHNYGGIKSLNNGKRCICLHYNPRSRCVSEELTTQRCNVRARQNR